jgi:hypothetical protein
MSVIDIQPLLDATVERNTLRKFSSLKGRPSHLLHLTIDIWICLTPYSGCWPR